MTREDDAWRRPAPVPIRTPRLTLRPYRPGDGPALAAAITESWGDLHPWFHPWMRNREDECDPRWQEVVACRAAAAFAERTRLRLLAQDGDRLVGTVDLIHLDWRRGTAKLAYWVRTSAHRKGHALEAAGAVTLWGFKALGLRLVTVGHAAPNTASMALITRLGFERSHQSPFGHQMPDGTLVDGIAYRMTDPARLPPIDARWT